MIEIFHSMNAELPVIVSIKCTVYNHEPYLRQCLDGFVMQKTNFRFEAIVHDDASTDKSADIIREYAEKYPDIIKPVYETENQYSKHDGSLSRIMNSRVRGKYVAMCEGDDYWIDPLKLQKQFDFLEAHPDYSMCFHNAIVFSDTSDTPFRIFNSLNSSQNVSLEMLVTKWIVPTASIMYRREMFVPYSWAKKIYSGDILLALNCFQHGKIYYLHEIMSYYRHNFVGESMSAKFKNSALFVCEQHIQLYEMYNQETNGMYSDILKNKISFLYKTRRFIKLKRICKFLPVLLMPFFSFRKLCERFRQH